MTHQWTIKHIFDGDFGCEERGGETKELTVSVTLVNESGDIRYDTVKDGWLVENGLDVGSIWPENIKNSLNIWSDEEKCITIRAYTDEDLEEMIKIWNEIVEDGIAFPQEELLDMNSGKEFFEGQTYTAVAADQAGTVYGLYILHPNNIGRCGHICNCSYGVNKSCRGLHIGEKLVQDSIIQGKNHGFRVLQFNAVVATNTHARHLYERLGFVQLGVIPKGFRLKNGTYEDICPYYREL